MEGKRRIMCWAPTTIWDWTTDPEVIEAGIRALEQYGTGCSGSRFLNGTLEMHPEPGGGAWRGSCGSRGW